MIEYKTKKVFVVGDKEHNSLREAQAAKLRDVTGGLLDESECTLLLDNAAHIIDVLSLTERSLPQCRKLNGGKKERKKKHVAAQFSLPTIEGAAAHNEAKADAMEAGA